MGTIKSEAELQEVFQPHFKRIEEWQTKLWDALKERPFYRAKNVEILEDAGHAIRETIRCNSEGAMRRLVSFGGRVEEMLGSFPDEDPVQEQARALYIELRDDVITRMAGESHDQCDCLDYTHPKRT